MITYKGYESIFIACGIVGTEPGLSGGEMRFIEIAKNWVNQGIRIHLLSSYSAKELCNRMGLDVELHNISSSKLVRRFTFFLLAFKSLFVSFGIRNDNIRVIYSSSEQVYDVIPGVIMKLKNLKNVKFVVIVHWLPPIFWWKRNQSDFFNSLFFLISQRLGLLTACFFADKILAVSESTKDQIKHSIFGKFFIKKVIAVKCGVNFEQIKKITSKVIIKKYDAVFMKRIQAVKGIFDLIEIWDIIVKEIKDAKLAIIGSGIDELEAKNLVIQKKLNSNIEFLGVIYDFEDKFKRIAESKLFLLPSYEENWAIVIGEALASGVPVITYNLKELNNVWDNSIISISLGDKANFASAIINYLNDSRLRTKRINLGLNYVINFDWKKIAENELKIIFNN